MAKDDDIPTPEPTPEPPNNDKVIKTIQDLKHQLQSSLKSDFGNISEQNQSNNKDLKEVKTTINQTNDTAKEALRIANEAYSAAINVNNKLRYSDLKIINIEKRIKSLEQSNKDIARATDNFHSETNTTIQSLHTQINNNN